VLHGRRSVDEVRAALTREAVPVNAHIYR
jgi:hypothetical protein